MSDQHPTLSDEQLNAFLDNQLDQQERALMLEIFYKDKLQAEKACHLRHVKDLVTLAYNPPPPPQRNFIAPRGRLSRMVMRASAAALLLFAGGFSGWGLNHWLAASPERVVNNIGVEELSNFNSNKIIIHINNMDIKRITVVLNASEYLLMNHRNDKNLRVEILVNAGGLNAFKTQSTFAPRIEQLAKQYQNIAFFACNLALKNAQLKLGHEITLLPQIQRVPSAWDQIVLRISDGWAYVRA